jgi:hypothetical protein
MSEQINITSLQPITKVVKVYSGHPGCACGCQGTYWPEQDNETTVKDLQQIKRIYKIFESNIDKVYSYKEFENEYVCLDISENRTYTIYYKI